MLSTRRRRYLGPPPNIVQPRFTLMSKLMSLIVTICRRWWWSASCERSWAAARCCPRGWGSSTGTSPPSPPGSPPPPHPGTATLRTVLPVFIFCIFPLKCSYWIYWFQGIGKIQSVCPGKFCLVLLTANKFWPNTFVRTSKYWDNIWNANCSVRSK